MTDGDRSGGDGPQALPYDEFAEQSVLGAILIDPHRAIREVANKLRAEEFYLESHKAIYAAMLWLDESRQPIDPVLVTKRLRETDELQVAGGGAYLARLGRVTPTAANIGHYARIVRDKALLRELGAFAREVAFKADREVQDVDVLIDETAQRALKLAVSGTANQVVSLGDALRPAMDAAEKLSRSNKRGQITGVPSGFHDLDKKTSGWQGGDLIILAARPGMGKTAFALNMLVNAAKDRRGPTAGVIFSLEMSKEQLATRVWCAESRVPMESLRTGDLPTKMWDRLFQGVIGLRELPIFIDDTPQISVAEMTRKCRQLAHEHDLGLIMVDYLQLMGSSSSSKQTSREQVISEISRGLKALARELDCPVIALSQLNRGVESRTDKRPMLSDLRESGAIEQDADIICFLYREDYYAQMKGNAPGSGGGADEGAPQIQVRADGASLTELIIGKHRSGPTGKVELLFHGSFTLFANLTPDSDIPPPSDDLAPRDAYSQPAPDFDYAAPGPAPEDEAAFEPAPIEAPEDPNDPF